MFIFLSPKEPPSQRENFNSEEIAAQHWVPYLPTMLIFLPPAPDALNSCRFSERVKQNRKNQGPVSRDQSHSGYKKQPRGTHYAFLNLPSKLLSSSRSLRGAPSMGTRRYQKNLSFRGRTESSLRVHSRIQGPTERSCREHLQNDLWEDGMDTAPAHMCR